MYNVSISMEIRYFIVDFNGLTCSGLRRLGEWNNYKPQRGVNFVHEAVHVYRFSKGRL